LAELLLLKEDEYGWRRTVETAITGVAVLFFWRGFVESVEPSIYTEVFGYSLLISALLCFVYTIYYFLGTIGYELPMPEFMKPYRTEYPEEKRALGRTGWANTILTIVGLFPFVWLLVNIPEYSWVALIYITLCFISFLAIPLKIFGEATGVKIIFTEFFGFGEFDKLPHQVFLSLLLGFGGYFGATYLGVTVPSSIPMKTVYFAGLPVIVNFFITVISIPYTEELIMSGVARPTIARDFGIPFSILITAQFFAYFHWKVYKTEPIAFLYLFIMAIFMGILVFIFKSFLPSFIAHSINNAIAFIRKYGLPIGLLFGIELLAVSGLIALRYIKGRGGIEIPY